MARQVAGVHRRYVRRPKRLPGGDVVPVVVVAVIPLQCGHRSQRRGHTLAELGDTQIPQVVGVEVGEQLQSHVRGRRPPRHHAEGLLLEVVGSEVVALVGDEGVEEAPRLAGDPPELLALLLRELPLGFAVDGLADTATRSAARSPIPPRTAAPREATRSSPVPTREQQDADRRGGADRAPEGPLVIGRSPLRFGGGHPLHQMLARHEHAPDRADDRVGHHPHLMGQQQQSEDASAVVLGEIGEDTARRSRERR